MKPLIAVEAEALAVARETIERYRTQLGPEFSRAILRDMMRVYAMTDVGMLNLIAEARDGDNIAAQVLKDIATSLWNRKVPLPGFLETYVAESWNGLITGRRRGKKTVDHFGRDVFIARLVMEISAYFGLNATRGKSRPGSQRKQSACSIVREAFNGMRPPVAGFGSEKTVEDIYNRHWRALTPDFPLWATWSPDEFLKQVAGRNPDDVVALFSDPPMLISGFSS
jgi:hypothetical protein